MKLYHGTFLEFERIDLSKSNRGKDFGKGFYLSDDFQQAQRMSVFKALQFGGKPVVQSYEFDECLLSNGGLSFKRFDDYSREWAEFVLQNRNNDSYRNVHSFDVIYGPIANDKVGVQIRNLLENNINMSVFLERLKYIQGITYQYFFGTEKAVSKLIRVYE